MLNNDLKEIRRKNKISQQELADAILTTRQTIYAIENGKSVPSLELALKIASFFNLSVERIFQLKGQQKTDLFTVF